MRNTFDSPLTVRHERFITEYLADQNNGRARSIAPIPAGIGAEQQTCFPAPEMSGEKTQKHGHLWTSGAVKASPASSGVPATAKELWTPRKVDSRDREGRASS